MVRESSADQQFHPIKFAIVFGVVLLTLIFLGKADAQVSNQPATQVATPTAPHANPMAVWSTSFEEAVKESQESNRPIMLFFTGSDWCPWCKKLWSEVFQTQDFAAWSNERVILVVVDFPRQTQLPEALASKNFELQAKYTNHLKSYPTALFLNPKEEVIGSLGYQPDGKHAWINRAQKFVARNDQVTQAAGPLVRIAAK